MTRKQTIISIIIAVLVTATVFYIGFRIVGQVGTHLAPGVLRIYDRISQTLDSEPVKRHDIAMDHEAPPMMDLRFPVASPTDDSVRHLCCTLHFSDAKALMQKWESEPGFLNTLRDAILLKVQPFYHVPSQELPSKLNALVPWMRQQYGMDVVFDNVRWEQE